MVDIVNAVTRSRMMSGIRGRDTRPERQVRSLLHRQGFRFRLHSKVMPGRPDLVLPKYRVAIFVHGCFWHGHDCALFKWPATRRAFWRAKILANRKRDRVVGEQILAAGFRHLTVWECAFRGASSASATASMRRTRAWLKALKPAIGIVQRTRA